MDTIALYSNGETIGWQDRVAIACMNLRTAQWHGFLYAISPSLGLFLKLEDGQSAEVIYGLGRPISLMTALLQEFGFVHPPDEDEDQTRTLVGGD